MSIKTAVDISHVTAVYTSALKRYRNKVFYVTMNKRDIHWLIFKELHINERPTLKMWEGILKKKKFIQIDAIPALISGQL